MRTQDEILRQAVFSDRHLIHARMTTDKSLFEHQHDSNVMLSRNTPNLDNVFSQVSESTFPMMVKLIQMNIFLKKKLPLKNIMMFYLILKKLIINIKIYTLLQNILFIKIQK